MYARSLLSGRYACGTLLVAAFALGDATGAASGQSLDNAPGAIEEITVTARRREEAIQDVPLSITAIGGERLALTGADNIIDIAQMSPNVTLEVSRGTNTTLTAFIRGVGQQDPVAGFEAGVGIYVDDVYLNRPQAAVLDIYDVERIEVLRGPQGTLYGRNTIGGAIKYVTSRLADEPEFKVKGSIGTYNQFDAIVTASAPLTDTFRIGGSLARLTRDGFGDNRNIAGLENYNKDLLGARLSMEWTPTDALFLRFAADYIDDDSDPRQGHRLTPGNVSGAPVLDDVFDTRAGLNNPQQSVEASGVALTADWQLSDRFTLKNIVAYREDESWSPIDFDSLPAADLDVPVVYENDQFSEELQLLYTGERLSGIVGAYYLDAYALNAFDVILGLTGDVLGLPGLNAFTLSDVDTSTWSLFADFTYDLTDTVSVSLGGRYTSDERNSTVLRQTMIGGTSERFGGTAVPIGTTSDFNGSEEFTEFTPKVSLSWRPIEEQHVYVSYSEGFKGGSFDPRGLTTAAPDLDGDGDIDQADIFEFMIFHPETVSSWELGLKSSWLDDRVTTSLAVFRADYEDVQVPGSVGFDSDGDGVIDSFAGITSNAADADINGVELEGAAQLTEPLSFAWSVGYIDAGFNEFIDAFGVDVADQRVFQNTPEWTANGTMTWAADLSLFDRSGIFSVIGSVSYRSEASQFEAPNPFLDQESFNLWDLSIVWEDDGGHWRGGIHGKNLADEEYKVAGYFFPTLGLESSITAFYGNPRTVTATVEYRF
ncbi:MAG: TonB-dependent receptor [Woeseiaceae bacterium]